MGKWYPASDSLADAEQLEEVAQVVEAARAGAELGGVACVSQVFQVFNG